MGPHPHFLFVFDIHRHTLDAALVDGPGFLPGQKGLGRQPFHAFFANAATPTGQRGWVDWQLVLKEDLAGQVLAGGIFHPPRDHRLIRQPVGMLQIKQPRHQPRRCRRTPLAGRKEPRPFALEHRPVDQRRQLHQLMPPVDHANKPGTQQIILFRWARAVFHRGDQNYRVLHEITQNPACRGEKNHNVSA